MAEALDAPRCGHCHEPLPWVVDASDADFADVADAASLRLIVDFWVPSCPHGALMIRALEQVAGDLAGQAKVVEVNLEGAPRLARRFSVQASPTLLVMDRGQVVARRCGPSPAHEIRAWMEQVALIGP